MAAARGGSAARGLRFLDFSIRAWRDGKELGVLAHATPVGSMRQPVRVALPRFVARHLRLASDATLAQAAARSARRALCRGVALRHRRPVRPEERAGRTAGDRAAVPLPADRADHRGRAARVPVSDNILRRESVCPVVRYRDGKHLATMFDRDVIGAAERLYHELSPPLLM